MNAACSVRWRVAGLAGSALIMFCAVPAAMPVRAQRVSDLARDEEIVFYSAVGRPADRGRAWEIEIRGCVFEPEQRRAAVALLREALELKRVAMTPAEEATFAERARLFMVDHERSKQVVIRIGTNNFAFEESGANGQFHHVWQVADADLSSAPDAAERTTAHFDVVLPATDSRRFGGEIRLLSGSGVTVVSDIDDTIKLTEVRDRHAMLRNTFLEPFRAVPGMAAVFADWATNRGTAFWYVSASPWQLYAPLSGFLITNQFPDGVFQLKDFRWKDRTFFNLFANPEQYKTNSIEPLFTRFPDRRFVLVGDSGERDPEAYAALARKYPSRVAGIFIRDVTGESAGANRYRALFDGLPPSLWHVFRDPDEIRNIIVWDSAPGSR